MLSNKLTFSLVLVLMFTLAATSVYAQAVPADATPLAQGAFGVVVDTAAALDSNGIVGDNVAEAVLELQDLADLLQFGGTIEISVLQQGVAADGTPDAGTFIAAHDATEAEIAALKYHIIISEIMWGRNASDADDSADSQWIELYNHGGAITAADALMLHFSNTRTDRVVGELFEFDPGTPADPADDVMRVLLDKVSTINNLGAFWEMIPGNSGNTGPLGAQGVNQVPITPLASMYRVINLDDTEDPAVYDTNDDGDLDGIGDGNAMASWASSVGRSANLIGNFIGSPGGVHVGVGGVTVTVAQTPATLLDTGIIINEVRNDSSEANLDWIELYYNGDAATDDPINIDGYELNMVISERDAVTDLPTGMADAEETLVDFPIYKLKPGEYFVVYNRDPADTILAAGIDVAEDKIRRTNKGTSHAYAVDANLDMPSDEMFLLVLRTAADQDNEPDAVKDIAGNGFFEAYGRGRDADHYYNTELFPLNGWDALGDVEDFGENTFASSSMSFGRITALNDEGEYRPMSRADNRTHNGDWMPYPYMGTGYDRDVDTLLAPGTPGYANIAVNVIADDRDNANNDDGVALGAYAFGGTITISEVMYDAGPRWNLIQWIELYNSSMTETINLEDWEMEIRNESTDVESYVDSSFVFEEVYILPNQTLLLVSGTGSNDVDSTRVYNLNQRHRRELGLATRDSRLLSAEGFALKLWARVNEDGESQLVLHDQAGNVKVDGAARVHMWDLPPVSAPDEARHSLLRQYGSRELDGNGPDAASDGMMETSWLQSDIAGAGLSYYGHREDISTPGFRLGGPLPVSLSSFRPVRNQVTGHVDITWVTQSELNNAGFNILRAESKTGDFKVINVKGIIAGHGTTSEKHVYTFTDTTAKPNVVYYYQIEDVSLNGNRTTLRTTHLRGNVSAGGKLTTRWGELKSSGK